MKQTFGTENEENNWLVSFFFFVARTFVKTASFFLEKNWQHHQIHIFFFQLEKQQHLDK